MAAVARLDEGVGELVHFPLCLGQVGPQGRSVFIGGLSRPAREPLLTSPVQNTQVKVEYPIAR